MALNSRLTRRDSEQNSNRKLCGNSPCSQQIFNESVCKLRVQRVSATSKHHRMLYTFIWTGVKTNKHLVQSEKGECVVPLCPGTMAVPRRQPSVGTPAEEQSDREGKPASLDGRRHCNKHNEHIRFACQHRSILEAMSVFFLCLHKQNDVPITLTAKRSDCSSLSVSR